MTDSTLALTRAQRRARTRAAILDAAREVFAENGYQKATIRAVAGRAGCDPALVMQHFGSKQELFREAATIDVDVSKMFAGPRDTLSKRLVRDALEHADAHPDAIASALRFILMHDQSANEALKLFNVPDKFVDDRCALEGALDQHAELRMRLISALTLGTAINRYVLKDSVIEQATIDDLVTCLQPVVEALLPPPASETTDPRPDAGQ